MRASCRKKIRRGLGPEGVGLQADFEKLSEKQYGLSWPLPQKGMKHAFIFSMLEEIFRFFEIRFDSKESKNYTGVDVKQRGFNPGLSLRYTNYRGGHHHSN